MRRQLHLLSLILIVLPACSDDPDPSAITQSEVLFLGIEQCCFNLEIKLKEFTNPKEEPQNNMLTAVNIEAYMEALDLQPGDSLTVNYILTNQEIPCDMFCNRSNGTPIQLMAAVKH